MRFAALLVTGCAFHHGLASPSGDAPAGDAAASDVAIDARPAFCGADPHLLLCFAFDESPLPGVLANGGAAAVSAQLTNVTSIASPLGGAAQLGTSSEVYVAMGSGVTGVLSAEVWFRYDVEPTNNGDRMGLFDSNVAPPNISLFFYRADPSHSLRCGIGSQTEIWDAPQLHVGTWFAARCICDGTNLHMFVDGTDLGARPGNCATGGAFVADGFTIGSNNNGGTTAVNDWLVGAIDGIRLWDTSLAM